MNEHRQQAYINLITTLLGCSSGEEQDILTANQDLLDTDFLEKLEEIAQRLSEQKNENVANWFRNLGSQIAQTIDVVPQSPQTQGETENLDTYLQFLQQVLQATHDSNGNSQVVYPLLEENLSILDDNFATYLQNWATAQLSQLDSEEAQIIAKDIVNFSSLIEQFRLGSTASNLQFRLGSTASDLEIAIVGYEVAATVFTREAFPTDWASIQYNLAVAYYYRIRGYETENREAAIAHFHAQLQVHTREIFPTVWASTQKFLGYAYSSRFKGDEIENKEAAIAHFTAALQVHTCEAFPTDWAEIQHNLAIVYQERIKGDEAENLDTAIAHFHAELQVHTREAFPKNWASTQNDLGYAYRDRIKGDKAENLEAAISHFQATQQVHTREAFPSLWARTQNNLANAYRDRIKGDKAENLEAVIAHFHAALQVHTRKRSNGNWAWTQNSLGYAYQDRIKGDKAENIEAVIAHFHAALEVFTPQTCPEKWAEIQNNLAYAYYHRIKGDKAENLEAAIAHFHLELLVHTRDAFPTNWASTRYNLAIAYRDRIEGDEAENIEASIAHFTAALQVHTREAFPTDWAKTQYNLAYAYYHRFKGDEAENLEAEIGCYTQALQVYTSEAFPIDWALTQYNLGIAYSHRIKGDKAENLETEIGCYTQALQVYTREAFPTDCAKTQNNLAYAYYHRIKGDKAENLEAAIGYYTQALQVYKRDAFATDWAKTQNNLGVAYSDRIKGDKAENLEAAIGYYTQALLVRTREAFATDWAKTQNNLGAAYYHRIKGDRAENLETAIGYYTQALQVYHNTLFPTNWARTQYNLGNAYYERVKGDTIQNLKVAIGYYTQALQVYRKPEQSPEYWAWIQTHLSDVYNDIIKGDIDHKRVHKYLNLIQALLFSPEYQVHILNDDPDLLDARLLKTIKQFAKYLEEMGDENAADFLIDVARQVTEILESSTSTSSPLVNPDSQLDFLLEGSPQYWVWIQTHLSDIYNDIIKGYIDDNRVQKHLNLIQALLHRHSSEYLAQVLNANPDLIDGRLVKTIELFAEYLQKKGDENAAYFLINLTCLLTETLESSSIPTSSPLANPHSQPDFLSEVLQATRDSNSNPQVVYPLLQENLDKLDDNFATVLRAWATERLPHVDSEVAQVYADRILRFSSLIEQFPLGSIASNLEIAIAGYKVAATVYTRDAFPHIWAEIQNNLGSAYSHRIRGDSAENLEAAIGHYQAALLVRTREAFPHTWAGIQNNLAAAYRRRIKGDRAENWEAAIVYYTQALQIFTREAFPTDWAMIQYNLGIAYELRIKGDEVENREAAIGYYTQALQILTREAFPTQWGSIQNNLGKVYTMDIDLLFDVENLEAVIGYYQNALEVRTRETFPTDWATTQNNLAYAYELRIKGDEAENRKAAIGYYQNALEIRTRDALPKDHAQTLFDLGVVYQNNNQLSLAYDNFAAAIETVESLRGEIISGDEVKQKLAEEWNYLYTRMVEVCLKLGNSTQAIEYVERSKTRNLVELILNRDQNDIFPPEIANLLQQLQDEIAVAQYQIQKTEAHNPVVLARHLQQLRQQRNELQNRYLPVGSGFKFDQFQATLDDHTAIIEWYISSSYIYTFIIKPNSATEFSCSEAKKESSLPTSPQRKAREVNVRQSEHLGKAWIDCVVAYLKDYDQQKDNWRTQLTPRLEELAKILHLEEIIEQLPPQCDRLILIPHRELHLFPLHALPLSYQGKKVCLLDLFPEGVSVAPSCQLLQLAQTRLRPNFSQLFAIQNPTGDLTYTDLEVQAIIGNFQQANVFKKAEATKAAINNTPLNAVHCAHFSCHGYFNQNNPRKSALILADASLDSPKANGNSERYLNLRDTEVFNLDNCLTLDEIFSLNLKQCRLVTLSACETGLIDYNNTSDEYIGLPSGFLLAGSSSVVSSLWKVDDISTCLLMIKFYQNLKAGLTVTLALNQAQIWLRGATKAELQDWAIKLKLIPELSRQIDKELDLFDFDEQPFQDPYWWAAFCAIGQ